MLWPVRWAGLEPGKTGQLKWNGQARKWRLEDPAGVEVSVVDVQAIEPARNPDRSLPVYLHAHRTTAVFSYQEALTGQLVAIDEKRVVNWSFAGQSLQTPLDLASAWQVHTGYIALMSEDFEAKTVRSPAWNGASIIQEPSSPAGPAALQMTENHALELALPAGTLGQENLFQMAFFVKKASPAASVSIALVSYDSKSPKKSVSLTINETGDSIGLDLDSGGEKKSVSGKISVGWHWFHIEMKPERTRFCIDGNVIHEIKSAWAPFQIKSMVFSAEKPGGFVIDGAGLFQADQVPAPLQRQQTSDLVQVAGGHEWFGKFQSLENQELKFKVGRDYTIPAGLTHAILPAARPMPGRWALGPVARVRFLHGMSSIWKYSDGGYLNKIGLLKPPPEGESCVEGVVLDLTDKAMVLGLSQGQSIVIPADRWTEINPVGASGLRVLESRPHHLGDEVDLKVIPPEPEGRLLSIDFESTDEQARFKTRLAIDGLEVLGTTIQPFVKSLEKGELVTEIWLNDTLIDNLNRYVLDKNEKPARFFIPIPADSIKSGKNILELRQKGLESDPNYLDDLSILGVRLYRID
ncbi:MAG: hypothetical protein ACKO5E_00310 [bacterium]